MLQPGYLTAETRRPLPVVRKAGRIRKVRAGTRRANVEALSPHTAQAKKYQGEMMRPSTARWIAAAAIAAILVTQGIGREAVAQEPASAGAGPQSSAPFGDNYQRSLETYEFKKAAASGPER